MECQCPICSVRFVSSEVAPRCPGPGKERNSVCRLFHGLAASTYQGVGAHGRPAAEPISEAHRFCKLHCSRCMKPLSETAHNSKALNKDALYWVCSICDKELRARGGQDSKVVWDCPTAAEGGSGCKCCCDKPKQAAPSFKRKAARGGGLRQETLER
jgi:hypothetical protein